MPITSQRNHPQPPLAKIAALTLGLALLVACGRGGTARFDWEPLSDEKALELLQRDAGRSDRVDSIIARVEQTAAPVAAGENTGAFNYRRFWRALRSSGALARMSQVQQRRLLALHSRSCQETDFAEFARLVADLSPTNHDFILGEFRRCQTALSPELTRDFLLRIIISQAQAQAQPQAPVAPTVPAAPETPTMPEFASDGPIDQGRGRGGQIGGPNAETRRPRRFPENQPAPDSTAVSRLIVGEILRDPTKPGWTLLACYLNDRDAETVERELIDAGQTELGRQLRAIQSHGCFH